MRLDICKLIGHRLEKYGGNSFICTRCGRTFIR